MTLLSPHITVCICTYRRPGLLLSLLNELGSQETAGKFTYSIVVVDNDLLQTAKAVTDIFISIRPIKVHYYVEPQQNIALARNKAIINATGDFVALIDDDEFPIKTWLLKHYEFLCQTDADGSLGPVLPSFDCSPPHWIIRGKYYERPIHRTGKILRWVETRTGNALLRRECFSQLEYLFDPRYGSGGEDKDFFRRAIEGGRIFRWCAEAAVFEHIPEVRCKRSFMIRRALLRGRADVQGKAQGPLSVIKSLVAIMVYSLALPVTLIIGHDIFMWTLIRGCDHFSRIAAICGINIINKNYILQ